MRRFKSCPVCGQRNNPVLLECSRCEADLSNVPIRNGEEGAGHESKGKADDAPVSASKLSADAAPVYRICECGHVNLPNARKCQQCGEDIADIAPVAKTAGQGFELVSLDGTYRFAISEGSATIGRHAHMKDYLADKAYVSRQHARLTYHGGELCIENMSTTNYTYVNNAKLAVGENMNLKAGDEVGLGGFLKEGSRQEQAAYFRVGTSTAADNRQRRSKGISPL